MTHPVKAPKKLIEVALPLDAINEAAAREKSIRHGHPSTLHLWWARRPLAAARAVIFAQLVNDPSWKWELESPGKVPPSNLKASWAASRKRLFAILTDLVKWESTTNEDVLEKARGEIRKSWRETCELNKDHPQAAELFNPEKLPGLHDPFAGGGAIPLEAQRLGLEAYASDLNPVAVLINKAMIEIPPKFAGRAPVGPLPPGAQVESTTWPGPTGLAEDVRRYGAWLRSEAEKRLDQFYPEIEITAEVLKDRPDLRPLRGEKLPVIAWIWARTVRSPSPACADIKVPLVTTFVLSSREGNEAYVEPIVSARNYRFVVRAGKYPAAAETGTKSARANFRCLLTNAPIDTKYIRSEAVAGRLGMRLLAMVAEGPKGRVYLSPTDEMERVALSARPKWKPELRVTTPCHDVDRLPMYGMVTWGDAFTPRQLLALTTFVDLIVEAREKIRRDAQPVYGSSDVGLEAGGLGSAAYADAVCTYLAFAVSKVANINSSIASWMNDRGAFRETFARQAIPMTWDFAEANPLADAGGSLAAAIDKGAMSIAAFPAAVVAPPASATQLDVATIDIGRPKFVSTDPPYYDNIGYADLSDFFYVWLRPALRASYPSLFATIAVPKAEELVAGVHRFGSKAKAADYFLAGMSVALGRIATLAHPGAPLSIYYAFKQSDTGDDEGTSSTGWETFLEAVIRSGLQLVGTWPVRTEGSGRLVAKGTNALASSIVLVCRKRPDSASVISRRDFMRELNLVLPEALDEMTRGSGDERSAVAPVDLSQAIIGPGMAVFSKYAAVLEAGGSPMTVKTALQLINRFLAEDDFDADTQFCLHWFEQFGWAENLFGEADKLARSKATSVEGLHEAGVLFSGKGKVRLRKWADYSDEWDPMTDKRLPIWEALHQLIRVFKQDGEPGAGKVLAAVQSKSEAVRQLAYRLYTLCERKGWAEDARAYNELVTAWSAIESAAATAPKRDEQLKLFGGEK